MREFGGVDTALDLGCGEGRILSIIHNSCDQQLVVGVDLREALLRDTVAPALRPQTTQSGSLYAIGDEFRERDTEIRLYAGDISIPDPRLVGFDSIVTTEVIEHLDPPALNALPHVVLSIYGPKIWFVSTPNKEYNALFPDYVDEFVRDADHRFEYTRSEFRSWVLSVAQSNGYLAALGGVGLMNGPKSNSRQLPYDPAIGHCTHSIPMSFRLSTSPRLH
ncbi:hypothetical protein M427DRAFT_50656 [Gonapodya prolifera JEL478]|uniref:Small RNA 2'-O-methyltransferase n=1 Tax=Gonapodya prolifera (strain JEL478) TaxID=1344416 RepID=A0A139B0J2_GONPJ|nr:hypothetical protein M427DRAFT_50656 [Gonapodya prolifera JEL478]|eukprot:KXS22323.1 hypothetical protein M427DRAFT_50656 [Gonapodya prolifera JEL478]